MKEDVSDKSHRGAEWIYRTAVLVILGILGFFLRDVYHQQKQFNDDTSKRISTVEVKQAESIAHRFTVADWASAKTVLDERDATLDKRVTRAEDAIPAIKASLQRIEDKLDSRIYNNGTSPPSHP